MTEKPKKRYLSGEEIMALLMQISSRQANPQNLTSEEHVSQQPSAQPTQKADEQLEG